MCQGSNTVVAASGKAQSLRTARSARATHHTALCQAGSAVGTYVRGAGSKLAGIARGCRAIGPASEGLFSASQPVFLLSQHQEAFPTDQVDGSSTWQSYNDDDPEVIPPLLSLPLAPLGPDWSHQICLSADQTAAFFKRPLLTMAPGPGRPSQATTKSCSEPVTPSCKGNVCMTLPFVPCGTGEPSEPLSGSNSASQAALLSWPLQSTVNLNAKPFSAGVTATTLPTVPTFTGFSPALATMSARARTWSPTCGALTTCAS
mmetsp:Transcript_13030/g.35532  ORF Transcript_13030/g.35532 Transcript_13030/m.35532 type:complete len:260 (+) Transcript_13030:17-796(+)